MGLVLILQSGTGENLLRFSLTLAMKHDPPLNLKVKLGELISCVIQVSHASDPFLSWDVSHGLLAAALLSDLNLISSYSKERKARVAGSSASLVLIFLLVYGSLGGFVVSYLGVGHLPRFSIIPNLILLRNS